MPEEIGPRYGIEVCERCVEARPAVLLAGLINHASCRCYAIIVHTESMPPANARRYPCPLSGSDKKVRNGQVGAESGRRAIDQREAD